MLKNIHVCVYARARIVPRNCIENIIRYSFDEAAPLSERINFFDLTTFRPIMAQCNHHDYSDDDSYSIPSFGHCNYAAITQDYFQEYIEIRVESLALHR